jgi:asparagine synthase (glutamine-hydrolysing)
VCGIVAIVTQRPAPLAEILDQAVARLAHRGPDDQGVWVSPQGQAGLGHARLSIIDLETGHQPIANEDGSLVISANGEFYGYERQADALRARGHGFTTRSDSEVALHLYEELGADSLALLRGEFAYAIWDGRERALFAARDRFGIKPLFYALHDGGIVVASEIKAILACGVTPAWDSDALFQSFHFVLHEDRTLFEGIRQVPPGHFLSFRGGHLALRRYWDADFPRSSWRTSAPRADKARMSEPELIEETGRRIEEAVAVRLRADVPIACYLSGGVDSSGVLGVANRRLGHRVGAFTISFEHPDFDEEAVAREMAVSAFSDYRPIRVTNADFAAVFVDSVAAGEGVQLNGHGPARYLLSREVQRAGYKVVLGGEGADELFLGYHFAERALRFSTDEHPARRMLRTLSRLGGLLRPQSEAQRYVSGISPLLGLLSRFIGFPDELLDNLVPRYRELRNLIAPEFLAHQRGRDAYREFLAQCDWRGQLLGREPVRQLLYLWLKSSFPNYVLAGERLDMAHAVEQRLPYLDHPLFEFVREIPAARLFRLGQNKHLLRRTLRPYVTERVYSGAKRPFFAPPSTLYDGNPLTEVIFDLLRSPQFRELPFFVPQAVETLVRGLRSMTPDMRASMDAVLFLLASLAVLQRRYGITSAGRI